MHAVLNARLRNGWGNFELFFFSLHACNYVETKLIYGLMACKDSRKEKMRLKVCHILSYLFHAISCSSLNFKIVKVCLPFPFPLLISFQNTQSQVLWTTKKVLLWTKEKFCKNILQRRGFFFPKPNTRQTQYLPNYHGIVLTRLL